jgi:hypothetical protein
VDRQGTDGPLGKIANQLCVQRAIGIERERSVATVVPGVSTRRGIPRTDALRHRRIRNLSCVAATPLTNESPVPGIARHPDLDANLRRDGQRHATEGGEVGERASAADIRAASWQTSASAARGRRELAADDIFGRRHGRLGERQCREFLARRLW